MSDFDQLRARLKQRSLAAEAERLGIDTAELILEQLERLGVSKSELAKELGWHEGQMLHLFFNTPDMTLQNLAEIGHVLGVRFVVTVDEGLVTEQ
ncbi:MAG: hypothetical protein WC977_12415 [Anaerovoracaceae bacterium]|jgi:ribosome-binding protein aMBF1 (putative translation factor)